MARPWIPLAAALSWLAVGCGGAHPYPQAARAMGPGTGGGALAFEELAAEIASAPAEHAATTQRSITGLRLR